jgi:8-oxo-dGTP pyrophosphatase MutT (NUDIX family)
VSTPVRDASTVVLLRDGAAGVEAWLLTRVRQMAFAAGMTVFPGGRVEASDGDVPWAGTPAASFADRLGCSDEAARALVGAAVRETFEETGVLLSTPSADLRAARSDVEAGLVGFAELLRAHGLAVDASGVRPWARWITPEGEPRRYDTRFFVAALPPGATAEDLTSESSAAGWVGVRDAIVQYERGDRPMFPPTIATLRAIDGLPAVADVLDAAAARSIEAVRPLLGVDGEGEYVELPDGSTVRLPR